MGNETCVMSRLNVHLDTEVFGAAKLNLTANRLTKLQQHCKEGRARLLITTVTRREVLPAFPDSLPPRLALELVAMPSDRMH
jgi:hypothetical protein